MELAVIDDLLELAKSRKIKVYWSEVLDQYTPPAVLPSSKNIVMNNNWHRKREITFQLAHEIAHILNNDPDNVAFYHATFKGRSYYEAAANERAVDLLIPIYCSSLDRSKISVCNFMETFCVPPYLEDCIFKKLKCFVNGAR